MEYPTIEVVKGAIDFDDRDLILEWFNKLPLSNSRHESKVISMVINYMVENGLISFGEDE